MTKFFLFALLLFSTITPSFAQTTAPASPVSRPVIAPVSDTVRAVHLLFSKRRTGGWIWTGIGAAFAARIIIAGAIDGNVGGALVGTAVLGGGPAAIGIGKLSRFSDTKEAQVTDDYQKTKRLPPYVQRRLKRKYFN
ncbi:MAG: hypothetical protein ACRYG7_09325 [Janthinobacterium lividum]